MKDAVFRFIELMTSATEARTPASRKFLKHNWSTAHIPVCDEQGKVLHILHEISMESEDGIDKRMFEEGLVREELATALGTQQQFIQTKQEVEQKYQSHFYCYIFSCCLGVFF